MAHATMQIHWMVSIAAAPVATQAVFAKQVVCVINLHVKTVAVVWTETADSNAFVWKDLLDPGAKQKSKVVCQCRVHQKQAV